VKVVVDTNLIIAGLVAEGLCRDIIKRRLPACELFTSRPLLDELAQKMREKFGLDPDDLPLLTIYEDTATVVKTNPCPNPSAAIRTTTKSLRSRWRPKLK
jgi:predicted nucleic acid-binding protein